MVETPTSLYAISGNFESPYGGAPGAREGDAGSDQTPISLVASGTSGGRLFGIDSSMLIKIVSRDLGATVCGGKVGNKGQKMCVKPMNLCTATSHRKTPDTSCV